MKALKWAAPAIMAIGAASVLLTQTGCQEEASAGAGGLDPKIVADSLFAVMEADRAIYTKKVIKRIKAEGKIDAVEEWEDSGNLHIPLPAQMFRMGAERAKESKYNKSGFFYQLKSSYPINKQNKAVTDVEKEGFAFLEANGGEEPFYKEEILDGKKYLTAIYADVGVSSACINCHNGHEDTPKTDFELGDVMGGVVLRLPL